MSYYASQGYAYGHPGIDYALPIGTPVLAMADGEVTHSGTDPEFPGRGIHVWIDHGDYCTVYMHLERCDVQEGQQVRRRERIGFSGYSGLVDPPGPAGAHLHVGLESDAGDPAMRGFIDPAPLLV